MMRYRVYLEFSLASCVTVLLLMLAVGLFLPSSVVALVAKDKDFAELVAEADLILVGTVYEMHGRKLAQGMIVTDIWLDIRDVIKGAHHDDTYTLQILGGVVDHEHLHVPGAPVFEEGATYTLFVKDNGSVMFPLVGVTQGQFRVQRDLSIETEFLVAADGRLVVGIDENDIVLTEPSDPPVAHRGEPPKTLRRDQPPLPLARFLGEVRNRLSP